MALQKTFTNDYGIDATYWKVVKMEINWLNKTCFCEAQGWKDLVSRDAEDKPLDRKAFDWLNSDFNFGHTTNNTTKAYNKIKALDEWEGATDV